MKILYVTDQIHLHGGVEKMLSQKINYWISNYGYQVVLCTSEQKKRSFIYPLNHKLKHIDLKINYDRQRSYFHPFNLIKSIVHFFLLRHLIFREKPDIVVSVNNTPEQYFLPFLSKGIPKVKEFHSSGITMVFSNNLIGKLKSKLFNLFSRYQALVVLNEDERKYYPFEDIYTIPNFFVKQKRRSSVLTNKTIVAAGRIAPVKQFDHLIKAWGLIASEFPEWEVKIFGNGDNMLCTQLSKLIEDESIPNVYLMGASDNLTNEMEKSSIFAMTSATECFPMVLLEAQAVGLPVISYDCPNGPRNILTHNINGFLSPHNDIKVFAINLSEFIRDSEKRERMKVKSAENIIQFSSENVMEMWDNLIIKLSKTAYV